MYVISYHAIWKDLHIFKLTYRNISYTVDKIEK